MAKSAAYHVTIVGAGIVGSAMAAALRRAPGCGHLRIALVDSSLAKQPFPLGESDRRHLRTATITPASRAFLNGVANVNWQKDAAAFDKMRVWDDDEGGLPLAGRVNFETQADNQALGYVVENDMLRGALMQAVRDRGDDRHTTIDLVDAEVANVTAPTDASTVDWVRVDFKSPSSQSIMTQLLVVADGAKSSIRDSLGMKWFNYSYSQRAIVANVQTCHPNDVAWQRFLSTGPIAMLPCRGKNVSNVVWSTTLAEAALLERASSEDFISEVNNALTASPTSNYRFPPESISLVGKRASFPLSIGHAPEYVRPRVLLMGDAAHVVHPLAGQGVNIGLGDVECAVDMVTRAVSTGRDLGERALLLTYQRERLPAALKWMALLHCLQGGFGVQWIPFVAARRLGMRFVNATPPVKDMCMRTAAGTATPAAHHR